MADSPSVVFWVRRIDGIADRVFQRPKITVAIGSSFVALALGSLGLVTPPQWLWAAAHLILIGLFAVTYPVLMAHGRQFIPSHLTGRGVSFLTLVNFLGVAVVQAASGWVMEATLASGQSAAVAYKVLFTLLALTLGAAVTTYLFSQERP